MPDEERIKILEDGRKVKFIYQELPMETGNGTWIFGMQINRIRDLPFSGELIWKSMICQNKSRFSAWRH